MIYVVEGVAGSGKDTLCAQLIEALKPETRRVLIFPEEAMLATWLYYFVPGIHDLRLDLADRLLDYCERVSREDSEATFVFNRFHLSYAIWRQELGVDLEPRHERIVARLKEMPLLILQALLPEDGADERSSHVERREVASQRFLEELITFHGHTTAGESYLAQQAAMTSLLQRDGLPYRQVEVRRATPVAPRLFEPMT